MAPILQGKQNGGDADLEVSLSTLRLLACFLRRADKRHLLQLRAPSNNCGRERRQGSRYLRLPVSRRQVGYSFIRNHPFDPASEIAAGTILFSERRRSSREAIRMARSTSRTCSSLPKVTFYTDFSVFQNF